ncbi:MAG TPA: hypothetical protein VGG32_11200 [Thermoplasmata archaeon]|jgi:hypothetical protein
MRTGAATRSSVRPRPNPFLPSYSSSLRANPRGVSPALIGLVILSVAVVVAFTFLGLVVASISFPLVFEGVLILVVGLTLGFLVRGALALYAGIAFVIIGAVVIVLSVVGVIS